jgi:FKBP-type peptidyl-prolyl cis-trans isomerase
VNRVILAGVLALAFLSGCVNPIDTPEGNPMSNENPGNTGLGITELAAGSGPAISAGQTAVVHYTGWLFADGAPDNKGRKFDSSRDRGQPFDFEVGAGEVIAGWDQGVAGMQAGQQRRLVIPAALGYGARGAGGVIPGGATLVFDVELLEIR